MLPLPTDNLYKFIALAGLVILGFSVYFPLKRVDELRRYQIQVLGEIAVLELQMTEPNPPLELKIKSQELQTKAKIETLLYEQVRELLLLMLGGLAIGGGMAVLGFRLWYFKIQKLQDLILKRDASKSLPTEDPPTQDTPPDVQQ